MPTIINGTTGTSIDGNSTAVGNLSVGGNLAVTGSVTGNLSVTGSLNSVNTFGFKNRIINGAMVIDQRNAGAAVSFPSFSIRYTVDRFYVENTTDGTMTVQQSSVAPNGFVNSLLFTTGTADPSLTTNQYAFMQQVIEGFNMADFNWGTANAQTVTLSFWVRSSLTGTFGGALRNNGGTRSYPFSYVINAADTWEQKSITIPGDTSGTWLTTNGAGIRLSFGLGVTIGNSGTAGAWASISYLSSTGATSVIGTAGATWQITGLQLEEGTQATSFDYRPYGTELALCQRYYYRVTQTGSNPSAFGVGAAFSATNSGFLINFPVTMRAIPSALEQQGTASNYFVLNAGGSSLTCNAVPTYNVVTTASIAWVNFTVSSGLVSGNACTCLANANSGAYLGWSAEL